MFNFDIFNRPEPYKVFLCKPSREVICELNGIDEESADLKIVFNNQFELSFDYNRYISDDNGNLIETNGYHKLNFGMNLLIPEVGFFKMEYPQMKFDGDTYIKSISARSIECELEDKNLILFHINTGKETSLEKLVTYDSDETEQLLNEYTGLPYDYIVFDNRFPEKLQKLFNKYSDGTTLTSTSAISEIKSYCDLIPRLKSKVDKSSDGTMSLVEYVEYTYDTAGENIVSIYLFDGFNERITQLITFYVKYHDQLSLISLVLSSTGCDWTVGEIDESLVDKKFQFEVDGQNVYSFLVSDVSGVAECIFTFDLYNKKVNAVLAEHIGKTSGIVIDKYNLMNSVDVSCDENSICTRFNVSGGNDIGISLVNFGSTRIDDLSYFINARDENGSRIYVSDILAEKYNEFIQNRNLARNKYVSLTKEYNQYQIDIDELRYRVPNDCVSNDWDTFTDEELNASLTNYNQLLVTLISLYKEDYGAAGCNPDGSVNENYLKNTEYWYDYYAYKQTIEQIEATIEARVNDSSYSKIEDEEILNVINAYKTEWNLYGTIELQNKVNAYNNQLKVLVDNESIILKIGSEEAKTWSELSIDEKTSYGNLQISYHYDSYMKLYNERESCQTYLDSLMATLEVMQLEQKEVEIERLKLVKLVQLKYYDKSDLSNIITIPSSTISDRFTDDEIKTINLLYIDGDYSNENILTTSLDNSVTSIDVEYELLKDAEEHLSIQSQPQITFSSDIDNLLVMPEFKDYEFDVGNFVSIEYYDDYFVNLRLESISFNPFIPENQPSISFTNYLNSKSKRSDLSHIFDSISGGSSFSSSSGSGGSNSEFGSDDNIDVTISNTMLSKLLNTEIFGTRVSNIILDTLKVNTFNAKTATFGGLAKGETVIDGKCITTGYIKDKNYNGNDGNIKNTSGSIINLETGEFNFAGGKLLWDGSTLKITGNGTGLDLSNNSSINFTSSSGKIISAINADTSGITITAEKINLSGYVTINSLTATGNTVIDGSRIITGYIRDKKYNGTNGEVNNTVGSIINLDNGKFSFAGGKLKWDGSSLFVDGYTTYSDLSTSGKTTIHGANITTGTISADRLDINSIFAKHITATGSITGAKIYGATGDFTGTINATGGTIANWTIGTGGIYNNIAYTGTKDSNSTGMGSYGTDWAFWAGNGRFSVKQDGSLYATNANISGIVNATEGNFTGSVTAISMTAKDSYSIYVENLGEQKFISALSWNNNSTDHKKIGIGIIDGWNGNTNSIEGIIIAKANSGNSSYNYMTLRSNNLYLNSPIIEISGTTKVLNGILYTETIQSSVSISSPIIYSERILSNNYDEISQINMCVFPKHGASSFCRPSYDSLYDLGTSSYKIAKIYAQNTTIQTSDEREKNIFGDLENDAFEMLFMKLKPIQYTWKNGKDLKTIYFGLGAQTTANEFNSLGLNFEQYSGVSHEFVDEPMWDGRMDTYGMDYNFFHMLTMKMTQKNMTKIKEYEARIALAEAKIQSLQNQINYMQNEQKE